jgi:hypothetical protein
LGQYFGTQPTSKDVYWVKCGSAVRAQETG